MQCQCAMTYKTSVTFFLCASTFHPALCLTFSVCCARLLQLATGGSAIRALQVLCDDYKADPAKIIFANMICAPEGLQALAEAYPAVRIVTAQIDEGLNEDKFIVPGLGDYGDRFFNST
jgi:hypothetical protein